MESTRTEQSWTQRQILGCHCLFQLLGAMSTWHLVFKLLNVFSRKMKRAKPLENNRKIAYRNGAMVLWGYARLDSKSDQHNLDVDGFGILI